jgi:Na+-driven multidrug efflux pump
MKERILKLFPAGFNAELLVLINLSMPIIATYLVYFAQAVIGRVLVGHVSSEALAAATLAEMFANAFGNSVVIGCSSACDTLVSQAFGAKNWERIGHISQRGSMVALALCAPVAVLWLFAGFFLKNLGQSEEVVQTSAVYIRWLLVGLPTLGVFEVFKKHLINIGAPGMTLLFTCIGALVNGFCGYFLVFYSPMGLYGAPLAISIGYASSLISVLLYFKFHRRFHSSLRSMGLGSLVPVSELLSTGEKATIKKDSVKNITEQDVTNIENNDNNDINVLAAKATAAASTSTSTVIEKTEELMDFDDLIDLTWGSGFDLKIAFSGWPEYLSLGLPSSAMLFTEWASYEATAIIAGLIDVNALATHSILATTASMTFMPILGFGVAVMIRIGNRLGERNPEGARFTFQVSLFVWALYAAWNVIFLLCVSPVWGKVFTDDKDVDEYVTRILWVLALYGIFDSGQCLLSFVFRAIGRAGLAACANVSGYIVVGLPLAYAVGISAKYGVLGIWLAYFIAVTIVFILLAGLLYRIDWKYESDEAYKRSAVTKDIVSAENTSSIESGVDGSSASAQVNSADPTRVAIKIENNNPGSEWLNEGSVVSQVKL